LHEKEEHRIEREVESVTYIFNNKNKISEICVEDTFFSIYLLFCFFVFCDGFSILSEIMISYYYHHHLITLLLLFLEMGERKDKRKEKKQNCR
jgi:hypothetical protein